MDIFCWETKLVNVGMEEAEQHSNRKRLIILTFCCAAGIK